MIQLRTQGSGLSDKVRAMLRFVICLVISEFCVLSSELVVPAQAATPWTGIIAPTRAIDWTGAGATIPSTLPANCATQPSSQTIAALNAAIAADVGGSSYCTIDLSSWGTVNVTGTLMVSYAGKGNVIINGGGPNVTKLVWTATPPSNCVGFNATSLCVWSGDDSSNAGTQAWPNSAAISSGYTQGSTSLVLANHTNLKVGAQIQITQNDPASDTGNAWFCQTSGANGDCSQQGSSSAPSGASETQMVTVTGCGTSTFQAACTSNSVTITPGIYAPNWTSGQSPKAWWSNTFPLYNVGIQNLSLDVSGITAGTITECVDCSNVWFEKMRQVNGTGAGSAATNHFQLWQSNHVTVEFSYMYGANPQYNGYGVDFGGGTSDSLALSNIAQHMPTGYITETGVGDVFAYNYAVDNYFGSQWQQCDEFQHAAGDYYDLYEGNVGICATEDDIHGTHFAITHYRNYLSGFDPATEGGAYNDNIIAINHMAYDRYDNDVANAMGTSGKNTTYQYAMASTTDCGPGNTGYVFAIGDGDQNIEAFSPTCGSGSFIVYNDLNVASSLMRWGNYDAVTGAVRECQSGSGSPCSGDETGSGASTYPGLSSPSTTFPASFFFSSQPSWWVFPNGTASPWPGIGPDVSGGDISGAGGHANLNPAANCYLNVMGGQIDGSSGLLPFNATACYGTSTPPGASTYWVSPTGAAAWASCAGATPLSGSAACSLATANANAAAGDLVYLRSGTYTQSSGGTGITPSNSGTSSSSMITFEGYPGDSSQPIISGGTYGIDLDGGNTYISVLSIEFLNQTTDWALITEGANHNQVANSTFEVNIVEGAPTFFIGPESDLKFPTHNWVHNNQFIYAGSADGTQGKGCTDGGGDDMDIGQSGGTYGDTTGDMSNNNTIENNVFDHDPHAAIDGYGEYTVIRNNVFHNEPWSSGCTNTSNYSNTAYSNSAYDGLYAHRDSQYSEDFGRNMTFNLFEGNRYGYAGINDTNDGAEDFDLATDGSIFRYNFLYASMGSCLQFKYQRNSGVGAGGNGGTYNRTYNNTFYDCGVGWPPATEAAGDGCNTDSCPFAAVAISNYDGAGSAAGNVLKNNLIYEPDSLGLAMFGADAIDHSPGGSSPPFSPTISWSEFPTAVNNWCTKSQSSSGACSATGNPLFNNPDISNPSSTTLPDLSLQSTSGAIDKGTNLTVATNSGSNSTTLTVADAQYFQDGTWGSDLSRPSAGLGGTMQADWIAIGAVTNVVQISAITYGTYNNPAGTITLDSPMTWSNGAPVWLYKKSDGTQVLCGAAPDIGAFEYAGGGGTTTTTTTTTTSSTTTSSATTTSTTTTSGPSSTTTSSTTTSTILPTGTLPAINSDSLPDTVGLNDSLSISNYPLNNVSFVWSFVANGSLGASEVGNLGAAPDAPMPPSSAAPSASFTSGAKTASLASYGLSLGTYQVTVQAVDATGNTSPPLVKTMTLVAADFSSVQVYPNPWRSDKHAGKSVTFANLPMNSTVKLFTASGHKVKELSAQNSGLSTWDLTNDSGDKVASGIYLYIITDSQGDKVRGKVAVIK